MDIDLLIKDPKKTTGFENKMNNLCNLSTSKTAYSTYKMTRKETGEHLGRLSPVTKTKFRE